MDFGKVYFPKCRYFFSLRALLRPKTGRYPMASHQLSQAWPPRIGRPIILQQKLPSKVLLLWPIRFDFQPKANCRKNCLWTKLFRNSYDIMCKNKILWLLLLLCKDFSQSKPIMSEIIGNIRGIGSELNGVATYFNPRIFSLMSWATIVAQVILANIYQWLRTS